MRPTSNAFPCLRPRGTHLFHSLIVVFLVTGGAHFTTAHAQLTPEMRQTVERANEVDTERRARAAREEASRKRAAEEEAMKAYERDAPRRNAEIARMSADAELKERAESHLKTGQYAEAIRLSRLLAGYAPGTGSYNLYCEALSKSGDYKSALGYYRVMMDKGWDDHQTYIGIGKAYHALGNYQEAIRAYGWVVNEPPKSPKKGFSPIPPPNSPNIVTPITPSSFSKINKDDPRQPYITALSLRGLTYLTMSQQDNAFRDFNEAIQHGQNLSQPKVIKKWLSAGDLPLFQRRRAETYVARGIGYLAQQKFDLAMTDFNEAINLDPTNSWAYLARSDAFSMLGQHERMLKEANEALRLEPSWRAYANKAQAHYNLGQYNNAINAYWKMVDITPASSSVYTDLSAAYSAVGHHQGALTCAMTAIELDAKNINAYKNASAALTRLGRVDDNLALWTKAASLNPTDYDFNYRYVLSYVHAGRLQESVAVYKSLIQNYPPDRAQPHSDLSQIFYLLGKHDDALQEAKVALKLEPKNAAEYASLGGAYYNLKDYQQALSMQQKAAQIEPAVGIHRVSVAWNYGKLNRFDEAREELQEAVRLSPNDPTVIGSFGAVVLVIAQASSGPARETLLKEAEAKMLEAEKLSPGIAAYNLARLYSVRLDETNCRLWLNRAKTSKTILLKEQLIRDSDFDHVRENAWFKEFLSKL